MPRPVSRLDLIAERLEQGATVTQQDVDVTVALVAIDIVRDGAAASQEMIAQANGEEYHAESREN